MNKTFRDDSPLTLVNGTQQMTWYPRRMDLPPLEPTDCASEGGTFREPAPARIPRNRPLFKSDAEMRAEGWEPVDEKIESAVVGAVALFIVFVFVLPLALWAYRMWVA